LVEYLLEAHGVWRVHPDRDLGQVLASSWILCDEFELVGIHSVDFFLTGVSDVPHFLELFAAGAEAEQKVFA